MPPCPNCGRPVPDGQAHCPNCGAARPIVWPPPPTGQSNAPTLRAGRLLTGSSRGDFALALALTVASFFVWGVGFIVMPLVQLALRRTYPSLARGVGWGWLVGFLGALAVCFAPPAWINWVNHLRGQ